ncbi:MAG: Na+/H+ antiporter NhaC family protein [archaeon]|nr:Na+/H+ antiporter NhaC family protein [archaeon]
MLSKHKVRGLAILGVLLVLLTFITVPINADEVVTEEETTIEAANFEVTVDGEVIAYDFSNDDDATAYVDNYSDNLQEDPAFESHITEALAKVREHIKCYATFYSLLPAIIAIVLALITKEVYSSLFIGILSGGVIYANMNFEGTLNHVFSDGFISSLADSYNVGIILFLVLLGALVAMMNKAGGSAAFGKWAAGRFKTRVGAQIATIILGILIFIDDYFNCLTVGSVMRPVTDKQNISRAKLAYLIDATAAPVCIIAPISSWAAAVAGFAKGAGAESGMSLFISAIPFNFYAILTIVMMLFLAITKFDFGPMKKHEDNAMNGDIFTSGKREALKSSIEVKNEKGRVIDLVIPVVFLIFACVIGMIYSGGFFTADSDMFHNFVGAFSESDASVGLVYGSFITLIFAVIYFMARRVLTFQECMESFPEGFKAMVPAIMILTCAWTLKIMTDSLGAKIFISQLVEGGAAGLKLFLPAVIFLIACFLSFATGTSWGTFGILIPIVLSVFGETDGAITIVAVSACMAGAVCGDHCSPISDTTIMASAGAECDHINHVSTQLPYAITVAIVSFVCYIIAGYVPNWYIMLPVSIVLMIITLFIMKLYYAPEKKVNKKAKAK